MKDHICVLRPLSTGRHFDTEITIVQESDDFENLGMSAVQFGPPESKVLACKNRHDLDVWHDRLLVPR